MKFTKNVHENLPKVSARIHLFCPRKKSHLSMRSLPNLLECRLYEQILEFTCSMWPVLQQRWWHGKLQRNPKVLATAVISLQIDLIFCAPTGINFFPLDIIFLCKIDNIHFFCLVQKSVTVCFQSILLVSKRLLIILLSYSKFFIGHCTHPLFLGTFSFAASSRIYIFLPNGL